MTDKTKPLRIAAVADIHVGKNIHRETDYESMFADMAANADVALFCGDLTDRGTSGEAEELGRLLQKCTIPKVAVLGNHDYTRGEEVKVEQILSNMGVTILGEQVFAIEDVGFAGVKGFGGGYGTHTLGAFGESMMKLFVQEAINEAEQLEVALDTLREYDKKVVLLHYSPIPATNRGEPLEIYPFLGTSRLEEVIDRHNATVVFHGHAHYGSPHGQTLKGIDVYNVALPIMQRISPKRPYRIIEL